MSAALKRIVLLGVLAFACLFSPTLARAENARWHSDYFPNVVLQDQNGKSLKFYSDVLHGKIVVINFVYTDCVTLCPLDTAQLKRVQQLLGPRVGRDIFMYSISINPKQDTPATLKRFMRTYDVGPGWSFLTGKPADITALQNKLGLTPPTPGQLASHDPSLIMGNEKTGQWIKRSSFENPQNIAIILTDRLGNNATAAPLVGVKRQSFAKAGEITDTSAGIYMFRTRCASCHTIGEGDRLGPDLKGVASSRNPAWLKRWIKEPDKMIAARDPIALSLMARYRNLPMPNLALGDQDVDAVIDYLKAQDAIPAKAVPKRRAK